MSLNRRVKAFRRFAYSASMYILKMNAFTTQIGEFLGDFSEYRTESSLNIIGNSGTFLFFG
jgi:hypothetical protein